MVEDEWIRAVPLCTGDAIYGQSELEKPGKGARLTQTTTMTCQNDRNDIWEQLSEVYFDFIILEEELVYTAAIHKKAVKMLWLYFWEALVSSIFICNLFYRSEELIKW